MIKEKRCMMHQAPKLEEKGTTKKKTKGRHREEKGKKSAKQGK